MWCPPEYILLADIASALSKRAWQDVFEVPEPQDRNLFSYDEGVTPHAWRNDRAMAFYLYTTKRFIESEISNFFFVNKDNTIQRISSGALYMPRVYDGPFPESISEWRGIIDHLEDNLIFIDEGDYSISADKCPEEADILGLERVATQLQEIDGRHLLWRIPEGCSGMSSIINQVVRMTEFDVSKIARLKAAQSKERPRKNIWDTIWQAYPDGKGEATWQDVEKKTGYSRRSINLALKDMGGHEKWAGGGQSK